MLFCRLLKQRDAKYRPVLQVEWPIGLVCDSLAKLSVAPARGIDGLEMDILPLMNLL